MKWKNIIVKSPDGETIFSGAFNELPVREDYIIAKSIELYNEPEPCIIYRTHISKKLYLDLLDRFPGKPQKGMSISLGDCPELADKLELNEKNGVIEIV
ncbi:MAG: hypothetical protein J5972_00605 [Eubacterium sp.]|nr:hypothetical protein [Eubacterium sp.]